MKLAAKRLENIGWLALVFFVAIMLYPLSLSVASLRSDLARTDRKIVSVKQDIRYLETEFGARANLRQLEEWNKLEYGYVSPKAAQYLEGERALANLGSDNLRKPVKVAVITTMNDIKPAGIIGSVFGRAPEQRQETGPAQIMSDASKNPIAADTSARQLRLNRTQKVATLDEKLLDDGLVNDLARRARSESKLGKTQ